jgi:hypothetical protein
VDCCITTIAPWGKTGHDRSHDDIWQAGADSEHGADERLRAVLGRSRKVDRAYRSARKLK